MRPTLRTLCTLAALATAFTSVSAHALTQKRLNNAKFSTNLPANTTLNAARTEATTQLPANINGGYQLFISPSFKSGSGDIGTIHVNPKNYQKIVSCTTGVWGLSNSNNNKNAYCGADPGYLKELNQDITVNIRVSSPGGGSERTLKWHFKRYNPPCSVESIALNNLTLGNLLNVSVRLTGCGPAPRSITWGLIPKACFQFNRRIDHPSELRGTLAFQAGETENVLNIQSMPGPGCTSTSGVFKTWIGNPGINSAPNFRQRGFQIIHPRR